MAGGGMQGDLNSQQQNPLAAAATAQQGGTSPTSNPFVRSGMAAMLMAQRQPQMGAPNQMRRPMGPGPQMPQMPMNQPQVPFSGAPGGMGGGVSPGGQPPWGGGFMPGQQSPQMGQQAMTPGSINPMLARQLGLMG